METELTDPTGFADCGCAYPDYVPDPVVARSNAIFARLRETTSLVSNVREGLAHLSMHRTVSVGGMQVGIVHGDLHSLAGWSLAVENLEPADETLRERLGCADAPMTSLAHVHRCMEHAGIRILACSHTCLPYAQVLAGATGSTVVINNGSAGMPNFSGTRFGLVTRISRDGDPHPAAVYGATLRRPRCDAVAVEYDHDRWLKRFLREWPPGSPAHPSYWARLVEGPAYEISRAVRDGVAGR